MLSMMPGLLLAASLTFAGNQPMPIQHPTPSAAITKEAVGEVAPFEAVASHYPPAVADALNKVRKTGGHTIVRENGKAYVVISAGQRPTGGYKLVADQVKRSGAHGYNVHVRVQAPAQGSMKIQVISYPTLVIAIPDQQAQVNVQVQS